MSLFNQLLAKAAIKLATENSIDYVDEVAFQQYKRAKYIVKVLRAGPETRLWVKKKIEENEGVSGTPPVSVGQRQLWCILVGFELLSAVQKTLFIKAYIRCNSVVEDGSLYVALEQAWPPTPPPLPYPYNVP